MLNNLNYTELSKLENKQLYRLLEISKFNTSLIINVLSDKKKAKIKDG